MPILKIKWCIFHFNKFSNSPKRDCSCNWPQAWNIKWLLCYLYWCDITGNNFLLSQVKLRVTMTSNKPLETRLPKWKANRNSGTQNVQTLSYLLPKDIRPYFIWIASSINISTELWCFECNHFYFLLLQSRLILKNARKKKK